MLDKTHAMIPRDGGFRGFLVLILVLAMTPSPGSCQTALYPHQSWTSQTADSDASDRAYEVAGSSYFRNQWFFTFQTESFTWFERTFFGVTDTPTPRDTIPFTESSYYMQKTASIETGTIATSTPYTDASSGFLKLTDIGSLNAEDGWLIISKGKHALGNNFRIRAKVWAGSTRLDSAAGNGFGFFMMPRSEYNDMPKPANRADWSPQWQQKDESDFPHHGIAASIESRSDRLGFSVRASTHEFSNTQLCNTATGQSNGFSSCKATYGDGDNLPGLNPCSCYYYCTTASGCDYKPTLREQNKNSWDTFEVKVNHSKVTLRYNGIDVFSPATMPGIFASNTTDDWLFLIGASSQDGSIDNHFIDDVEISYWTQKKVPYPPKALTQTSATSSSVTIGWTPHEDDGGAPVRWYRIQGESVNQTCSADERSPLFNVSCTFYFDYSNCSTAAATCAIPNLRRATLYYITASGINVVGEGPNMTTIGYGTQLVVVHPALPQPPDSPVSIDLLGPTYVHLSWSKTPDNGGATVNGWAIKANASPAPPSPGSPNPTAVSPAIAYVFGIDITSFRLGVDQAYDIDGNPITVVLKRWTNYTFQVAATNKYTLSGVGEVGGLGPYSNATDMVTTPAKEPTLATWSTDPDVPPVTTTVWERPGHTGVAPLYPIPTDTSFTVYPLQTCWWPCRMKLIWTAPSDDGGRVITSYRIFRGQEVGTPPYNYTSWPSLHYEETTTGNTSWIVKGLLRNTKYFFKVAAVNSLGEGPKNNAVEMRSLDYPDVANVAYKMPTSQSSTQTLTGNSGNNPYWGSTGTSDYAVDGLTNPDFRLGQSQMTDVEYSTPWWRVQFAQKSVVVEMHLFMCSVYMPVTQVQIDNCKSKFFKATLYEEIDRVTETWSTTVRDYTLGTIAGIDMLDTGWTEQNAVSGLVDIRLTQQPSTSQIHPHFRLKVGGSNHASGSMMELKDTLGTGKLAFSEVRIFGWKRGCNEEYTCNPSGGVCVARKWNQEFRKCVCNPGYYGETCHETATGTGGDGTTDTATKEAGRDLSAIYTSMIGIAIAVMAGVWGTGFALMYAYYVLTGMGYSMGGSAGARVAPELTDREIRMKYVPGSVRNNGMRVGGSSAARAMRKSQAPTRSQTRRGTMGTGGIEDVINPGQAMDLSGQIGREPPCGMSVGLWRVVKDRWSFLLGLGALAGAVAYLLMVMVHVMADAKGNTAA